MGRPGKFVERTVLTDAFFQFRDLYYESVEMLYLNKNSKKEDWENQLQDVAETFRTVTREIEFWEYYKAL
ncbi:MAG: hypothetical protein IJM99_11000 [Firmicutes bacterium]|nr:hypothetical protein [Bacillota bacterium]